MPCHGESNDGGPRPPGPTSLRLFACTENSKMPLEMQSTIVINPALHIR